MTKVTTDAAEVVFKPMPPIARWNRRAIITEKIDGTNMAVLVYPDGRVQAATKEQVLEIDLPDHHGFRAWVQEHADELRLLGPGLHRGEWWGDRINKRYPGQPKRFSLFNVRRWKAADSRDFFLVPVRAPDFEAGRTLVPACVSVVPVLAVVESLADVNVAELLQTLRSGGSLAAPGCRAEGLVVFHEASGALLKATCEKDDQPKRLQTL